MKKLLGIIAERFGGGYRLVCLHLMAVFPTPGKNRDENPPRAPSERIKALRYDLRLEWGILRQVVSPYYDDKFVYNLIKDSTPGTNNAANGPRAIQA